MELEPALSLPNQHTKGTSLDLNCSTSVESKGLSSSLLLWSGGPNQEDKWRKLNSDTQINNKDEIVAGWPPISTWMRKELVHTRERVMMRNSMHVCVKVKMKGVPIARKVNLALFNSYPALAKALINMFAKCSKIRINSAAYYTVLYQDKEGDWMLVGDVPWETFMESVQRLEVLRSGHY